MRNVCHHTSDQPFVSQTLNILERVRDFSDQPKMSESFLEILDILLADEHEASGAARAATAESASTVLEPPVPGFKKRKLRVAEGETGMRGSFAQIDHAHETRTDNWVSMLHGELDVISAQCRC